MLLALVGALAIAQEQATQQQPKAEKKMETKNPIVEIKTNHGSIYLEVFEKETPIHAGNFLSKVDAGKYDSITFHRIAKNRNGDPFVIQGGDPTGTGSGSMGEERLADEKSPYPEVRGTVAMARSPAGASNCQFYINMGDNTFLDKQNFSAFAKVVKGMDVADKIMQVKIDENDRPLEAVVMTKLQRVDKVPAESSKAATAKEAPQQK
jgi:peptidyl-prolyl cis-trans isomerase B (cyclophilin B)